MTWEYEPYPIELEYPLTCRACLRGQPGCTCPPGPNAHPHQPALPRRPEPAEDKTNA